MRNEPQAFRVLVLDPDPQATSGIVRALESPKLKVDHARTRPEAFARLGSAAYGAVLSVHARPLLDGIAFLQSAEGVAPDALLILVTADFEIDVELAAHNAGRIFRFFSDPFEARNLVGLVEEGVKLQRLQREQRELAQRLGLEYQKLQRREKLLDVVVRERTREIEVAYQKLKAANRQALLGLAEAIEAKDPYTKGHCGRTAAYAMALARECGFPGEELEALEFASFLHDVGKIGVKDAVLLKPGPLDEDEWLHMKTHPVKGYEITADIDMLRPSMACIRNHHERWDGKGYPDGLKAEQIPLGARIVSIADAFDAMATDRPYKRAMSAEQCRTAFHRSAGTQYDPALIDIWIVRRIGEGFLGE
jgi:response regulator RpfG family c-di-GMP phosphodiesterase